MLFRSIELLTLLEVDPNGEDGIVLYDSLETGKANDVLRTEENVFMPIDPIVRKYQREASYILNLMQLGN